MLEASHLRVFIYEEVDVMEERDQMYNSIASKLSNAISPPTPKAQLTCSLPNGLLQVIPLLDEDAYLTGGNNPINQVKDKAKAIVRRAHKRYYLQVLNKNEQTFVNHEPVHDARSLKNGDLIQIGDIVAVYYMPSNINA